jgi:FAD binding domain-containing protein/berberine-like enzyme
MATVMPAFGEQALQELGTGTRGDVIRPGDDEYESARRVWNGTIDRRPGLIVRCTGAADVLAAVRFAGTHELPVAIRGGGHGIPGFGTCDGGMVIDLAGMKSVRVDPRRRIVRVEGGATWGELDRETQEFGLATTGGLISTTGIAGLTLGGGFGWLARKHGLSCDNLVSADVVTADGRLLTASEEENADLLWALRGGGGNFGVVTSFEYRLHPVGPILFGGALFYPIEQAADFLRFHAGWSVTMPEELGTSVALIVAPEAPFVPAELVGTPMIAIAIGYLGELEHGEAAIAALRDFGPPAIDLLGPIPYTALQAMFDGFYPHGLCSYWKTEYLAEPSDDLIETVLDRFARRTSPLSQVFLEHYGGAVAQVGPESSAVSHRELPYRLLILANWTDPAEGDEHVSWARDFWEQTRPFVDGGVYVNYLGDEGPARIREAYGAATYDRLVAAKRTYDPTNFFRLNQNIPPGP